MEAAGAGLAKRHDHCFCVHHVVAVFAGFVRTYVLSLDPAQYQLDVNATAAGEAPDVYATFNVLMRRDAKENNFKVQ